jgi:hypothetical protein
MPRFNTDGLSPRPVLLEVFTENLASCIVALVYTGMLPKSKSLVLAGFPLRTG